MSFLATADMMHGHLYPIQCLDIRRKYKNQFLASLHFFTSTKVIFVLEVFLSLILLKVDHMDLPYQIRPLLFKPKLPNAAN